MKNKLSFISLLITCIGACGVGVNIMLSELLYADIDEFTSTPIWYQIFMYISLFISGLGIILSILYRNKSNTKRIEIKIELLFIIIGLLLMFGFALQRYESYTKDVLICVGGCLFSVGIFCFISTQIGLHRNKNSK